MLNNKPVLGILGGLGPMATAYFYELVTEHTVAHADSEHIDIVISSRASTPDRTAFILGESEDDPREFMIEDAKRLQEWGCDFIAIPCNTAHYFYDSIADNVSIPVLNIVEETAKFLNDEGIKRVGLLATDGTVCSHTYEKYLKKFGIECIVPNPDDQKTVMHIIYDQIKEGRPADIQAFYGVVNNLKESGAQALILGCTELPLIGKQTHLGPEFVDSLLVLARASILACGKDFK